MKNFRRLGAKIVQLRREKNISPNDIAQAIDYPVWGYRALGYGTLIGHFNDIEKIANVLGVETDELFKLLEYSEYLEVLFGNQNLSSIFNTQDNLDDFLDYFEELNFINSLREQEKRSNYESYIITIKRK